MSALQRLALIAAVATACSSPAPKPAPPEPPLPAAPPPAAKAEPEPSLPEGPCQGRSLDVEAIAAQALCPLDEVVPAGALVASVPAQTKTEAGFEWIDIELRNPGKAPVTASINPRMAIAGEAISTGQVPSSRLGYRLTIAPGGVVRMRARCLGPCARQPGERVNLQVQLLGGLGEIATTSTLEATIAVKVRATPAPDPTEPPEPPPPPANPPPRVVASPALLSVLISGERLPKPDRQTLARMRASRERAIAVYKVCIGTAGQVTETTKLRSSGYPIYDSLVAAAIDKWVFRPFQIAGAPAAVCAAITFVPEGQ